MGHKLTWEEMKIKYPEEWLLITDFELDESGRIISGNVDRHSSEKDDVYRFPSLSKPSAFRFTGESSFAGLKSHAEKHHTI